MAAILHEISLPLQLAALFVIVLAGVAKAALRSGTFKASSPTSRLLIDRVFQAAVLALVLGVGATLAAPLIERLAGGGDATFHGVVLNADRQPIDGARVTLLAPSVQSITNALGAYDLVVPRSHQLPSYRLEVSKSGYHTPEIVSRSPAEMQNLELQLMAAPAEQIVRSFDPAIAVGQFIGVPVIAIALRVENPLPALATITDMRATLTGPGAQFTLQPRQWSTLGMLGPYAPVSGPVPIPPGWKINLRVVLEPNVDWASLVHALSALPQYAAQLPCAQKPDGGTADPPSDQAYAITAAFAERHFAWKPGAWHLQVEVTANDMATRTTQDFTLSADDVAQLHASFALMKQCQAVLNATPFGQDGTMANFVTK